VRTDGQKVLLAVKSMGGESSEAWRGVLDDLISRGLRRPELLIMDGGQGLERAIAAVWDGVPVQRCTVGSLKKWVCISGLCGYEPNDGPRLSAGTWVRCGKRKRARRKDERRISVRRVAASRLRLIAAAVR
jgi:Transposase, Mutator family